MNPPTLAGPRPLRIRARDVMLAGDLAVPEGATALVVFAHGSGSSRLSPRNVQVANTLQAAGFATLLFDLLTEGEERVDVQTREFRFDIELLGRRLTDATRFVDADPALARLSLGYFGASTGSAAALIAAAALGTRVKAVVSRGGRPDLAASALPRVSAPTLLIVGSRDDVVIELNERASRALRCPWRLALVPGATHLFEEPGALEAVAGLAREWFARHLVA